MTARLTDRLRDSATTGNGARRTCAVLAALAALVTAGAASPASASVFVEAASSYSADGDRVAGWDWLRDPGDYAQWTFAMADLSSAKPRSAYLNVNTLVTNGVNGGSGYSVKNARFTVSCSAFTQDMGVRLDNPFRPLDPQDSAGVGYASYGASTTHVKVARFSSCESIVVRTAYPFGSGRHVAFRADSVTLAFRR